MKNLLTLFAIILGLGLANAQTKKLDAPTKAETKSAVKGPTKEETLKFIKDLYGATNRYFTYRGYSQSSALANPVQLLNVELVGDRIKFTFKDEKEQTSASISGQILINDSELNNGSEEFILGVHDGFKSDLPKKKKRLNTFSNLLRKVLLINY